MILIIVNLSFYGITPTCTVYIQYYIPCYQCTHIIIIIILCNISKEEPNKVINEGAPVVKHRHVDDAVHNGILTIN